MTFRSGLQFVYFLTRSEGGPFNLSGIKEVVIYPFEVVICVRESTYLLSSFIGFLGPHIRLRDHLFRVSRRVNLFLDVAKEDLLFNPGSWYPK